MALIDIATDNNNNFIITNKDITLHKNEGSKLFSLRNYLNTNKQFIVENLNEDSINKLMLSKCLKLDLNTNNLDFKPSLLKEGTLYLNLKIKTGE